MVPRRKNMLVDTWIKRPLKEMKTLEQEAKLGVQVTETPQI